MLTIGLTGGIGSGKSLVCDYFAELEVPIIDADIIARDVVAPGEPCLKKITDHFGKTLLTASGELDRAKLKQIIFDDPNERRWLEDCLHPAIRERMSQAISHHQTPFVILAIPLLVETLPNPLIDRILVIDVEPGLQIRRVMTRDGVDEKQAGKIIASQASREQRLKYADDILSNNGNLESLKQDVERLNQHYLKLANQKHN